jgi:Mn-dependent DtxR family transcriptional regulator
MGHERATDCGRKMRGELWTAVIGGRKLHAPKLSLTGPNNTGKHRFMNTTNLINSNSIPVHENELSHSMVHYLLTIHKLKESRGFARVTDIAKELQLTKGSVSTAINNLKKRDLVTEEEDCKFLILTDRGHDEVHRILSSRTLLFYFLKDFVGVSEKTAERDSCLMEHLMSHETNEKFFKFMKDLACACEDIDKNGGKLPEQFKFETTLDLCDFKSASDFLDKQVGDSHLPEEETK